jgi:NADPH:quinone reductase-like Zn-dependent oxidoreductase
LLSLKWLAESLSDRETLLGKQRTSSEAFWNGSGDGSVCGQQVRNGYGGTQMSDATREIADQHHQRERQCMRAAVYERYGPPDVLALREVEKPIPKDNQVLIKIHATTVTSGDWRARSLNVPVGFGLLARLVFGVSRPRQPILGTELAGEIEAVGKDVRTFKVGDQVFAFSGAGMGCHAEYKCMPEHGAVALKPPNLTYDEAAALSFGGTTVLDFFRRGKLQSGERVLVNGASGGVGTAAVQLARHFDADVTGVCSSANVELVRSLGATHVIDYTREDFTQNGEAYDIIVDTVGTAPFSRSKDSLKEGGRLLLVLGGLPDMLQIPWVSLTSGKKVIAGPAAERADDLRFLAELAQAGTFRPVIDRRYPFEQIVEAHRYVDTGRKKGNVIITLKHGD